MKKELTEEQIIQIEALGAVLSKEQIADYFGMSKKTLSAIFERQPETLTRYKKGKAKAIASVAGGLLKDAMAGDPAQRMFYLKTQAGWRETKDLNHKSDYGSMSPNRIELTAPGMGDAGKD